MARKWERMVEKNKKNVNAQRKKQGKAVLSAVKKEEAFLFRGRSWMLALLFIGFSIFYMVASGFHFGKTSTYNWVIILYLVFGLYLYFIRRPNLKIGKSSISSQRFTGPVTVAAADIEGILIQTGYVVIRFKRRRSRWIFSRFMQWFDIQEMSSKISDFATYNAIALTDETKGE